MRRIRRKSVCCLLAMTVAGVWSFHSPGFWGTSLPETAPSEAKTGDIILVEGRSIRSVVVRFWSRNKTDFSHIGILIKTKDVDHVIHADPTTKNSVGRAGVIMERWGAMVAPGRVTSVAVFQHPSLSGKARESLVKAAMAATRENVPFDHQFDAAYTNAFYCTEFVEWLYNGVGLSLLEEKVRRPEFIFPEHCLSKLKQIGMSSTPRRR